ncbi:alkaline phosphatase family protein [Raineyella sp. LH-20]|uniref:phospholipase C n=1 Tax=Raineyella sp. LH-20 TaxID=3081204 RepID=UPI002952D911|nr:alkaline phosphatase family protein [Raineyella sp. LH-20]WOP18750.1 alkaline phosphatase family protein [Raineyella sp. LH-20]
MSTSHPRRRVLAGVGAVCLATTVFGGVQASAAPRAAAQTTTPIKHVVVIFQENVSFDHYFATYPYAANTAGEQQQGTGVTAPAFQARPGTPKTIDTLQNAGLLAPSNPNSVQPFRLTPGQQITCDQDHTYTNEQRAYDGGLMDKAVETTSKDTCATPPGVFGTKGLVMGYYDGNTVTGLWNYAQQYAMSDNSYSTTFGPSTPGALNLISGQTHGVHEFSADGTTEVKPTASDYVVRVPDANGVGTVTNDPDPVYDDCSNNSHASKNTLAGMDGRNIGDLLNDKGVSWGWFQGGFRPTTAATATTPAACKSTHTNVGGASVVDYSPHHEPFQYYKSTANPHHVAPAGDAEIGHNGQANHQYDLTDFDKVVTTDNLPAVSFLKASSYQDGHANYSDPADEQAFIAKTVNEIQQSKNWQDTAVVIAYDDSDGWYDHAKAPVVNASASADDAAWCTDAAAKGTPVLGGYADRCGYGPRQPLLVISPYAKTNYVDHTLTDQSSILTFVEDNWQTGRIGDSSFDAIANPITGMFDFSHPKAPTVLLDQRTGTVTSLTPAAGQGKVLGLQATRPGRA